MLKVAAATVAYGAVHSLLATRAAKRTSRRLVGPDLHNGLYRLAYNGVAAGGLVALIVYARRQPSRDVYRVEGPAAGLLHAGQAAAVGFAGWAVVHAGAGKLLGVENGAAWLAGGPVPPVAEGQGPSPAEIADRRPDGPFRHARNPLNFALAAVVWLHPRMTTTLLAFNLVTTAYVVVGSWLTERRLRAVYGDPYAEYLESEVPFLVPAVRPQLPASVPVAVPAAIGPVLAAGS